MALEFDSAKDAENRTKHGLSLAAAEALDVRVSKADPRFTREERFRAWGYLDGDGYCLAYTLRGSNIRAISLRRAHAKEMKRHGA